MRLGQEVQALPRAVRVTAKTKAKTKSPGERPAIFHSGPMIVQRKPDHRLSKFPVGTTGAEPLIAVLAGAATAGVTAAGAGAGACASVVLIGWASACLARIAPFEARLVGLAAGLGFGTGAGVAAAAAGSFLPRPTRRAMRSRVLSLFGSAGLASAVFDENRLPNKLPPLDRVAVGVP